LDAVEECYYFHFQHNCSIIKLPSNPAFGVKKNDELAILPLKVLIQFIWPSADFLRSHDAITRSKNRASHTILRMLMTSKGRANHPLGRMQFPAGSQSPDVNIQCTLIMVATWQKMTDIEKAKFRIAAADYLMASRKEIRMTPSRRYRSREGPQSPLYHYQRFLCLLANSK
jgi:hypothetical protein